MRYTLFIAAWLYLAIVVYGQEEITNQKYLSSTFNAPKKNILILGENHASAVGTVIYPDLIKSFHQKKGVSTMLIEFGPSEAYFYSKYLETGEEKHLNYTIYGNAYPSWKEAWREIYAYNKTLSEPLQFVGIDFDRTRTLAYALYSMFLKYKERPVFVDSLMNVIKTEEFYQTYTIGYPTKKDIAWKAATNALLRENLPTLKSLLNENDYDLILQIVENQAVGYDDEREKALGENVLRIMKNSDEDNFFMLIGRSHAYVQAIYDDKERLATILKKEPTFNVSTGAILFQNSALRSGDKAITLREIETKIPWKEYTRELKKKVKGNFTVIPMKGQLKPLSSYLDYVLVAINQEPLTL